MEPSADVRQRIMDAVRDEKDGDARVIPFASARRNVWTSFGSLGAIAAVVLFAALIVAIFVLWQQNRTLREQNEIARLLIEPGSRVTELKGRRRLRLRLRSLRTTGMGGRCCWRTGCHAYGWKGISALVHRRQQRADAGQDFCS